MLNVIEATATGVPALDIMVPTHNRLDLTMRCMQAIFNHTQSPSHIVVVDDSDDGLTPLYFAKLIGQGVAPLSGAHKNITFIHSNEPFKEGNQFFNIALRYCKTDFMATVMNSIRVEPEWEIFALNALMPQNPDVGIIGFKCLFGGDASNYGHIESSGIKMVGYMPSDIARDHPGHRFTGVAEVDAVQWAFALLRTKAVIGNLEEGVFRGFRGWDDIDNCLTMKKKGWRTLYCGFGVGYHDARATRGSNDEQVERDNLENGEIFYKRHGLWEMFLADHTNGSDPHSMPKDIQSKNDTDERLSLQPVREEIPA